MKLSIPQRREIIEDILDIQVFSIMNQRLKDKVRENNEEIKDLDYQVHLLEEKIDLQKKYMFDMEKRNKEEVDKKSEKIACLMEDETMNNVEIERLTKEVEELSVQMKELSNSKTKLKKLNKFLTKIQTKLSACQKEHGFFKDNHVCPTCTQELSEEFRSSKIQEGEDELNNLNTGLDAVSYTHSPSPRD